MASMLRIEYPGVYDYVINRADKQEKIFKI